MCLAHLMTYLARVSASTKHESAPYLLSMYHEYTLQLDTPHNVYQQRQ
jgi:hypothetical protein